MGTTASVFHLLEQMGTLSDFLRQLNECIRPRATGQRLRSKLAQLFDFYRGVPKATFQIAKPFKHGLGKLLVVVIFERVCRVDDHGNFQPVDQPTKATSEGDVAFKGRDLPLYSREVATLGLRYDINHWTHNLDVYAQSGQRAPGTGTTYITQPTADGQYGDIPG